MDSTTVNLGLYTFSSLIQADATIFGLFALFLVYRLQSLESNMQTALSIGRSQYSPAQTEFEQLVLGTPLSHVHSILFEYSRTIYFEHLKTVAFTPKWKNQAIRSSIPVSLLIILHTACACAGLYHSSDFGPVLGLYPHARIFFILFSFVFLLAYIAFTGHRSFSSVTQKQIDPIPKLKLDRVDEQSIFTFFPEQPDIKYLYEVERPPDNRFVQLFIDGPDRYRLHPLRVTNSRDLTITHHIGVLSPQQLKEVVADIKNTPDKYWPKA